MFSTQKALLKLILSLMLEANKIQTLQKELTYKKKNEDHRIILNYARIMFNLIISPNNVFKAHFIEE